MTDLKKKILWQCRRGLWELDAILIPFVERIFDDLNSDNQNLFKELLSYEDVEVFDLLVNKKEPINTKMKPLVDMIIQQLYPYIFLSIIFVSISFLLILGTFILLLRYKYIFQKKN